MTSQRPAVAGGGVQKKMIGSLDHRTSRCRSSPIRRCCGRRGRGVLAAMAEKYNQPGKFTTFVAFEWTSTPSTTEPAPVRDLRGPGAGTAVSRHSSRRIPSGFGAYPRRAAKARSGRHRSTPQREYEQWPDVRPKDMSGRPLDADYAQRRMANEPLAEIIQGKGQSDTSPELATATSSRISSRGSRC